MECVSYSLSEDRANSVAGVPDSAIFPSSTRDRKVGQNAKSRGIRTSDTEIRQFWYVFFPNILFYPLVSVFGHLLFYPLTSFTGSSLFYASTVSYIQWQSTLTSKLSAASPRNDSIIIQFLYLTFDVRVAATLILDTYPTMTKTLLMRMQFYEMQSRSQPPDPNRDRFTSIPDNVTVLTSWIHLVR